MKRKIVHILTLCILALAIPGYSQHKLHAFLIGISEYPQNSGWDNLHCDNDILIVKEALLHSGFGSDNIFTLQNEDATKSGILAKLNQIIDSEIQSGDQLTIVFSGHGQQVVDQNGDETDGLDEALAAYDSKPEWSENYKGEGHITDDELEMVFNKIRIKLGPEGDLFVMVDACYSGTMSKSGLEFDPKQRGAMNILGAKRNAPKNYFQKDKSLLQTEMEDVEMAPLTLFSASSIDEPSREIQAPDGLIYGPLCYSFANILPQVPLTSTYEVMFDLVKMEMVKFRPYQTPVMEGKNDRIIFSGQKTDLPDHFNISHFKNDTICVLNGGILNGLNPGSLVGFYKPGTVEIKKENAIELSKISAAANFESMVRIESEEDINGSWVYILEKKPLDHTLKCHLSISTETVRKRLNSMLKGFNIEISDEVADELTIVETEGEIRMYSGDILLFEGQSSDSFEEDLGPILSGYILSRKLLAMDFKDNDYRSVMSFLSVQLNENQETKVVEVLIEESEQGYLPSLNEAFVLKVSNMGLDKLYFNIISINDSMSPAVLLPAENMQMDEVSLIPGEEKIIRSEVFEYQNKCKEKLLLISSRERIDMRKIFDPGLSARSDESETSLELKKRLSVFKIQSKGEQSYIDRNINVEWVEFDFR